MGTARPYHQHFHDACKVRVAVFDDGSKRVALAGTDTLMIPRHLVLTVREVIERKTGIDGGGDFDWGFALALVWAGWDGATGRV